MKIENDKYYTPKDLAKRLIDTTFDIIGKDNITDIIEPSAGNGSFSSQLPKCTAYDIVPEAEGIIKQDYLEAFIGYKKGRLIIGNPPFGSGSQLAISFYKRSIKIADYIAFVLPISFLNNDITLYEFDLIHSEDLGEQDYSGVNLQCCFNIYKRPKNGLNPKPNYVLKDITILEYSRKSSEEKELYKTEENTLIKDGWDYAICNFGSGCLGKTPKYVGQYANELYVYVNNKKYLKQVGELLEYNRISEEVKSISMKKIGRIKLYKYLKDNIEGIE